MPTFVMDDLVIAALESATDHSHALFRLGGHWQGECMTNVTPTAEYVLLRYAFGLDIEKDREDICKWILSEQTVDGSWSTAFGRPGSVSCTAEAYLVLKLYGISVDSSKMQRARDFMVSHGGIEATKMFTRIVLAGFGLFPWAALPWLPAEMLLLPSWFPVNIDISAPWGRTLCIAYTLSYHHKTINALPNGVSASNNYLDELWVDPTNKMVPYRPTFWHLLTTNIGFFLVALIHQVLSYYDGMFSSLRQYSRRVCVQRLLSSQEPGGDWRSYSPIQYQTLLALKDEGFSPLDDPVRRGLEAMDYLLWKDEKGTRCQACPSPIWDTSLMLTAVLEAGVPTDHPNILAAVSWLKSVECLDTTAEWRIMKPNLVVGGFGWSPRALKVPDTDDTLSAVNAFILQDPRAVLAPWVIRGIEWMMGQQMPDGGFPGFEANNNPAWMNKLQFDEKNMFDQSSADVTGHSLKVFSAILSSPYRHEMDIDFVRRLEACTIRAFKYVESMYVEDVGGWLGTWGVYWIYGTSWALVGLKPFASDSVPFLTSGMASKPMLGEKTSLLSMQSTNLSLMAQRARTLIAGGVNFLRTHQNPDGGWGEELDTLWHPERAGVGPSSISQTSWALIGLLPHLSPTDECITRGIKYLLDHQIDAKEGGKTWHEDVFTGSGFPGAYDLRYELYRHHFPIMALARWVKGMKQVEWEL